MRPRNTWLWGIVACALIVVIFFHERREERKAAAGPLKVLPGFQATAVSSIEVRPKGQFNIRAERTNNTWTLTEPLVYPAEQASVANLLSALERLTPAAYFSASELQDRPTAEVDYGFSSPQALITLQLPGAHTQITLGARTAPGDQAFLQVAGTEGVFVVDADWLKFVPHSSNDWRNTTFVALDTLAFDRITVTNGATVFELQNDATNKLWRMVRLTPARANTGKIEQSIQGLQNLRVSQFVSDDPKADLEALGLQPPKLEIILGQGANTVADLQFGASPTNAPGLVYARRVGNNALVTLPEELLAPWRSSVNDFRDPHLVNLTEPVGLIEIRAEDTFTVHKQTNNTWSVTRGNFAADLLLVRKLLSTLAGMQAEYEMDVVTDWPAKGLADTACRYTLYSFASGVPGLESGTQDAGHSTPLADLYFATNRDDRVYARRGDEPFLYSVKRSDLEGLPSARCQLRDRQIWTFATNDIAGVTIRQHGKSCQLIRKGPYEWSLAPGSQGIINDLAVEETVRGLDQLAAVEWVAVGVGHRARCGFEEGGLQITLDLKSGEKATVEFGGQSPSGFPYAAVTLDGEFWIFQVSLLLYRDVMSYLTIPQGVQ